MLIELNLIFCDQGKSKFYLIAFHPLKYTDIRFYIKDYGPYMALLLLKNLLDENHYFIHI
jgi:hypothetical protein